MSGMKQLVVNTQERAVSTDINRAQLFKSQDVSELLRFWLDVVGNDDLTNGVITEPNTIETPLRAEIVNGLLARPQLGSNSVLVDPGVVLVMAPDGSADESDYKFVRDDGVTSFATLIIAAGGGGTRIDVIECQINPIDNIVTDNRDVFNPVTGLFTATVITKERSARLTFRVRQGAPGGGYPGNVSGWLPLCVASVPNAAVNNDGVTFWDVRPLISDRGLTPSNVTQDWPLIQRANFGVDLVTVPGQANLAGQFRGMGPEGRRLGGILRRGSPGTDGNFVDLLDVANQASGYALAGTGFDYVYLLTPFGLPRWARYTDAPGVRVPRSPCGIPVVTTVAPNHLTAKPSAAVALPTSTGLGGSTTSAILVSPLSKTAGVLASAIADGKSVEFSTFQMLASDPGAGHNTAVFTFTEGITHPANAKGIWARLTVVVDTASNKSYFSQMADLSVIAPGLVGLANRLSLGAFSELVFANTVGAPVAGVGAHTALFYIPVPVQYPSVSGTAFKVETDYGIVEADGVTAPTAFDSATLFIMGYDLIP
jgi:hypothetical protein